MKTKQLLLILPFLIYFISLQAQISKIFLDNQLKQSILVASDSTYHYEHEAVAARKVLEKLLGKLKYDREAYFGKYDILLKKGMHEHFDKNAKVLALKGNQDKNVVKFIGAYKALYRADRGLSKWEFLKSYFEKEKQGTGTKKITARELSARHSALPTEFSSKLRSDYLVNWTRKEIQAIALAEYKGGGEVIFGPKVANKIDLKLIRECRTNIPYTKTEPGYPIPSEWVAASYPADGEYNFYVKEWIRGTGYFFFNRMPKSLFQPPRGYKLMVRWTDALGTSIYAEPQLNSFESRLDFAIPDKLLKKEMLYKLDIVLIRTANEKVNIVADGAQSDESFFRQNFPDMNVEPIKPEQVMHSIYFRTSKWDSFFEKTKAMEFVMDATTFIGKAVLDEPWSSTELDGRGKLPPPVRVSPSYRRPRFADAVGSKELAYYLSKPEIEPVDTNDWTTPLQFEIKAQQEDEKLKKAGREIKHTPIQRLYGSTRGRAYFKGLGQVDVALENGHVVPALPDKLPFKFNQNVSTGFITKENFESGVAPSFPAAELTVQLEGPKLVKQKAGLAKEQIKKRREERAHFFRLVNIREKKKNGNVETRSFSDFLELDKKYMPGNVRRLLEADDLMPPLQGLDLFVYASKTMPGTSQRSTEASISIKVD